jgi:hypothetical protein
MSVLEICQWLYDSQVGTALRESQYMFPIVEGIHVLALGASVGLVLWIDLRFVGAAMTGEPAGDVIQPLRRPMLAGFAVMAVSGSLLFWSEAARLYPSTTFRFKLAFLAVAGINALTFEVRERRRGLVAAGAGPLPGYAKAAGWISLICWTAVILFGRWTAYGL